MLGVFVHVGGLFVAGVCLLLEALGMLGVIVCCVFGVAPGIHFAVFFVFPVVAIRGEFQSLCAPISRFRVVPQQCEYRPVFYCYSRRHAQALTTRASENAATAVPSSAAAARRNVWSLRRWASSLERQTPMNRYPPRRAQAGRIKRLRLLLYLYVAPPPLPLPPHRPTAICAAFFQSL